MIASLNIVAKTFAKIAKTFAGLSVTIMATRRRPVLVKVNHQKKVNGWCQQVDRWWRQQMTSARADVVGMTSEMTSVGNPVVREAHRSTSPNLRVVREGAWTIRWNRFFFDDVDQRSKILMVSAATWSEMPWWRVRHVEFFAKTLTGAWQRVDG